MTKPKVAFYWCASCGGCEESIVDLNEELLAVAEKVEFVFMPVAMDFKRSDVEALADGEIAVSFINGSVRTSEHEEMAHLLRKKSQMVVAYGSCAHLGGIPGLGNFHNRQEVFDRVYREIKTVVNPDETVPLVATNVKEGTVMLPEFYDTVKTLDQTIDVDYYLPGCAPPPDLILNAISAILTGVLPPKGTVLAPDKTLCDTCPLKDSKPEKMCITAIKRPHEVVSDPEKCFLAEGIICMGPATRSGCGERCVNVNMPCRGCFGPTTEVVDQGAKALSSIVSIMGVDGEEKMEDEDIKKLVDQIIDPAGTFYRFALPASLLRRKRIASN